MQKLNTMNPNTTDHINTTTAPPMITQLNAVQISTLQQQIKQFKDLSRRYSESKVPKIWVAEEKPKISPKAQPAVLNPPFTLASFARDSLAKPPLSSNINNTNTNSTNNNGHNTTILPITSATVSNMRDFSTSTPINNPMQLQREVPPAFRDPSSELWRCHQSLILAGPKQPVDGMVALPFSVSILTPLLFLLFYI